LLSRFLSYFEVSKFQGWMNCGWNFQYKLNPTTFYPVRRRTHPNYTIDVEIVGLCDRLPASCVLRWKTVLFIHETLLLHQIPQSKLCCQPWICCHWNRTYKKCLSSQVVCFSSCSAGQKLEVSRFLECKMSDHRASHRMQDIAFSSFSIWRRLHERNKTTGLFCMPPLEYMVSGFTKETSVGDVHFELKFMIAGNMR
jgi:hypothetical protein